MPLSNSINSHIHTLFKSIPPLCLHIPTTVPGCHSVFSPQPHPISHFHLWLSYFQYQNLTRSVPVLLLPPYFLSFTLNLSSDLSATPKNCLLTFPFHFTLASGHLCTHSCPEFLALPLPLLSTPAPSPWISVWWLLLMLPVLWDAGRGIPFGLHFVTG